MYTNSYAASKIDLISSKSSVEINEEFNITVNTNGMQMAACTIWIYFDNEKVECTSQEDYLNVVNNRVIFTWIAEDGKNKTVEDLIQIPFKAKQKGIASFSIIGEFYNQNGEQIEMNYSQVNVQIGQESDDNVTNEKSQSETELANIKEEVSKDNANLKIMRLNHEGVNPDFNKEIKEYYLIVDENTGKLDITAVPENEASEVKITGNENLKNGMNTVKISVTSEDKSNTNEYIVNVTKTNDIDAANADLETLAIENYTLSPEYQSNITNYVIEVSNTTERLNILAIPQNQKAKVEVSGNEELNFGDNQVILTVTAENGITKKEYIIQVHKRSDEEENLHNEEQQNMIEEANQVMEEINNENTNGMEEEKNEDKQANMTNMVFQIVGIVLSIIVIGIVVIRVRNVKKNVTK